MKHKKYLLLLFLAIFSLIFVYAEVQAKEKGKSAKKATKVALSKESKACLDCHGSMNPGIVKPWEESRHAAKGVGCYECHQANQGDPDAMKHNGFTVSVIVSPKDCNKCHSKEVEQMTNSHHAQASKFTGSLDNVLGRIVEGEPNFNLGCGQCHGRDIPVGENGKLQVGPWPNTGIGRLNPDGSKGSCTACHQRHFFSVAQAREPKTCGKCHQGPDHPQIEIYELSKHGIAYEAFKDKLNMNSSKWVLGEDYTYAPTCTTCHMGGTRQVEKTHDVGTRIAWTLRPPISKRLDNWEQKRSTMKKVCSECHQQPWIDGFFTQFDSFVDLYNEKFAIPSTNIMNWLKDTVKLVDNIPFNEKIEWEYYELWHHEGRRARHGASMNAPDWSHWHGLYETAQNFYMKFLPSVDEIVSHKGTDEQKATWKKMKDELFAKEEHKWFNNLSKEESEKVIDFYKKRYGKEGGLK